MLSTDEQRQARRVRELIHDAGGLEAAAEEAKIGKTQLGRYQSTAERDSMPLRVIEALEAVTVGKPNHPVVTRYLAARQGYTLVKRPEVPADRAQIMDLLAKQATASGTSANETLKALMDDDRLDAAEARELIPLYQERLQLVAQMLAELEAIAGEEA